MSTGTVPSCHSVANVTAGAGAPVVAFVGAPNSGKSTLFNSLTGSRATTGNWPGTTVEVARGVWRRGSESCECGGAECTRECAGSQWTVLDLPGAYSLEPASPDEELTRDLIVSDESPDLVVAVVDAAHLARSLYLVAELRERALRVLVVLTMIDRAREIGESVDSAALSRQIGAPVVVTDPRRRGGLAVLGDSAARALAAPVPHPRAVPADLGGYEDLGIEDDRFAWLEAATDAATVDESHVKPTRTDRFDKVATAPVLGPLVFLAVMWAVFQLTTTIASPLQTGLDWLFSGPVSDGARWLFGAIGLGGTAVEGLVVDGLIAGVGMVLTFVPLMAIMFTLLAILEDSGYLARAAVVTDDVMRRIGLPGRAFLPLIVGFGCNVPAIAATRILPSARQRRLTALLVPFTSCSARLTVYVMLGQTFFGAWGGTVVFAMYVISILLVVGVGYLMRSTLWRTMGVDPLVLDLPPYQRPTLRLTLSVMWTRLQGFLRTAGGIIVGVVIAVWLMQSIPVHTGGHFGEVPIAESLYGWLAQAVAPVFAPAGFGGWEIVSALLVGFVAKEAVLSSWAQTFAGGDAGLPDALRVAFETASGGHTTAAVLAFLVFLLAYTPCVATLATQRREIGLRWTLFGIAVQLAVAYGLAVAVFQVGRLL